MGNKAKIRQVRYLSALQMVLKSDISREAKMLFVGLSRNVHDSYVPHFMYHEKEYPALNELASLGVIEIAGAGSECHSYSFPVKLCLEESEWQPKRPAVLRIH